MTAARTRLSGADLLFWLALASVIAANVAIAVHSLAIVRLWEDEAFNLSVPLNLLRGLGYSSDGTLSGSFITPFDVRISTGPVVLLPVAGFLATGLDMVVVARLVPLAFFASLLVAAWLLGRRVGGRWAGVAALAAPLTLNTLLTVSPIQGPADVLGEIPAAALLAWALWAMRTRPWLAGLLVGLAIQAKYISVLAVPAYATAVFFAIAGQTLGQRLLRLLPAAALTLVPTAVFEAVTLFSLGRAGYRDHLELLTAFVVSGGQPSQGTTVLEKLSVLASAWYLPSWLALLVLVLVVGLGVAASVLVRGDRAIIHGFVDRETLLAPRELLMLLVAAGGGMATFVVWWSVATHTPLWIRHPAPGLLAFTPVLTAFVVLAIRVLAAPSPSRRAARIAGIAGAAAIAVAMTSQVGLHLHQSFGSTDWETLGSQRSAASEISPLGNDWYAGPWGASVSIAVMSGAHAGLWDAPVTMDDVPRLLHRSFASICPDPDFTAGVYLVCPPSTNPE